MGLFDSPFVPSSSLFYAQDIVVETVLFYFKFLFEGKSLTPATVSSYRSALARPFKLIFNIDVSSSPFVEFIKLYSTLDLLELPLR